MCATVENMANIIFLGEMASWDILCRCLQEIDLDQNEDKLL